MPAGRPTKYTPELVEKAREYLANYEEEGHAIPSNAGLSLVLGISRDTVQSWAHDEEKKAFSDILEKIQATQEVCLISKGLKGEFNSNIAKLALGKHGYHDKQDLGHSGAFTVTIPSKDAGTL